MFWNLLFPWIPLPVKLSWGSWWFAVNDYNSNSIFADSYENAERLFVERFLKPGMTVIDIGAHHGFYTLLASKKVGSTGTVIAFEPSPRERKRLLFHLKINRYTNAKVEPVALAACEGKVEFYIVQGKDTGCNSLRPPVAAGGSLSKISVKTRTLDSYLVENDIQRVDFIKIDAEGAELEILRGAKGLFDGSNRPVILCEIADSRTNCWGYDSGMIIAILENHGYQIFGLDPNGEPMKLAKKFQGNILAVPA